MPGLLILPKTKPPDSLCAISPSPCPRSTVSALMVSPFASDHRVVRSVFEQWNWDLFCASTREEGTAILSRLWIPVIICEQRLRDGDWRDFLNNATPVPPRVVVISRLPDPGLSELVSAMGGFSVLESPMDSRAVSAAVSLAWHSVERQRRSSHV